MSVHESKLAKLNIQSQIIDKMIEENEQKLNKECIDIIDKILNNDYTSKYLYMVEFLKQWKLDIEKEKQETLKLIDVQKRFTEAFNKSLIK